MAASNRLGGGTREAGGARLPSSAELTRSGRSSFLTRAKAFDDRRWDGVVAGSRGGIGLDAAFVLDTTGSMSVHLNEVRLRVGEIAAEIAAEVPRTRLGV